MKAFYFRLLIFFALILRGGFALGQVANDDCATATVIKDPRNFCSDPQKFTNIGATTSTISAFSFCLSPNGSDVWFSFRALAKDVRVTIQGATASNPTGTLRNPEAGIYEGKDCESLSELVSNCDKDGTNIIEIYKGGLIAGEVYYVRVQGRGAQVGTFKLCITNYNPPSNITSDCPTSTVLCDKSPFSVTSVIGFGRDSTELDDATCFITPGNKRTGLETNSTWFKWICEKSGTLEFTITPSRLDDDIDFALYKLNNINICSGKTLVRCMAAGSEASRNPCKPVFGPTGIRDSENDISEPPGCSSGQNGFIKSIDMVAGEIYALGINNFTSTGNGFSIDWGGTGTFVGPLAKIKINKPDKIYCLGEDVILDDASSFAAGRISNRSWRFGKDASIDTANGVGPFKFFYKTPGWKSVVLTITSERGCIVTNILDSIYIKPFEYDSLVRRPTCNGGRDGLIRMSVKNCGRAPIRYNWENTGYTTVDSISGLFPGIYRVAITDSSGVYIDTFRFILKEFEVEIDRKKEVVTPPKCFGLTNGSIVLTPITGDAPFRYRWNNNTFFTLDNTLTGLGEGFFTVEIRDNKNCKGLYAFDIAQPPPLSISVENFNISCFGRIDGYAVAYPSGGVGKYSISWSNGAVGDTVFNLKKGTYVANVVDGNECFIGTPLTITEPPQIGLTPLSITPTKCYGDSTGSLVIIGNGGTPPFRYSIDGIRFQKDTVFKNIPGKKYNVVVRDSTGCRETIEVDVKQPPQLQVNAGPDLTVELGFSIDLRAIVVPSSRLVSYKWIPSDSTLSCFDCPAPTARPLRTTVYAVSVRDSSGCMAIDDVELKVLKIRPIFIPNVFSPNGDGVNDYFAVFGNQAALLVKELRIYDRWGGQVFEGRDIPLNAENRGWDGTFDGKQLNPDAFTFYALIRFIDGEEVLYKGSVTLVR
jgi:gliding motility-associated-like protein